MTYATLDQLQDRYGERMLIQLTDRATPPAGAIDTDVTDRALADAGALIDGYLKGRYRLPLASVPPLVTDLALKVAIYNLHGAVVAEKVARDYQDALKLLREIAAGIVRLDVEGAEPEASGSSGVRTNEPERPLSNAAMKGFV